MTAAASPSLLFSLNAQIDRNSSLFLRSSLNSNPHHHHSRSAIISGAECYSRRRRRHRQRLSSLSLWNFVAITATQGSCPSLHRWLMPPVLRLSLRSRPVAWKSVPPPPPWSTPLSLGRAAAAGKSEPPPLPSPATDAAGSLSRNRGPEARRRRWSSPSLPQLCADTGTALPVAGAAQYRCFSSGFSAQFSPEKASASVVDSHRLSLSRHAFGTEVTRTTTGPSTPSVEKIVMHGSPVFSTF